MPSSSKVLFALLVYFFTHASAHSEPGKELLDWSSLLKDLQRPLLEDRQKAENKLCVTHDAIVDGLLRLAEGTKSELGEVDGTKELAILLLARLRSRKAVTLLIKNITFAPRITITAERFPGIPCVQALVAIGKPGSLAAVGEIPRSIGDATRTNLLLKVIGGVEGEEVGRFILEQAEKTAATEEERSAYRQALEIFHDAQRIVN